jgi:ABC-type transport system involved in multi-copper enzyme maturation permease subunit
LTAALSLARHTFADALRERAFLTLGIFLLVLLAASRLLNPLALGEGRRVTIDLGLGAIAVFGFLLVMLLGTRMVQREIDSKTILMILAKPIRREEFVIGKFLGLLSVLSVSLMGMMLLLAGVLLVSGYEFGWSLAVAGYFALLELIVLAAVTMLLTAFTSSVLSTFFLIGIFVAGHLATSLTDLARLLPAEGIGKMVTAIFYILPRLDLFSYTLEVVHGTAVPASQLLYATLYAVVYSIAILFCAVLIFRTREFS